MLHAERRICTVDAAGVRSQQGADHPARRSSTTERCRSSRRRIPYFEVVPRATGARRPRKAPPAATSRSRSTAGACSRSTPRGASAWPITDALFARLYALARAVLGGGRSAGGARHHVYFSNDRERHLRASATRSLTLFDHFVHLAELTTLRRRGVRGRADRHRAVHADRARAAARRPRAAARDPRQLLPQAVPRVRARVDHPGADAGARDPRPTSRTCCRPTSRREAARTAAVAQRVIEELDTRPPPQRRDRRHAAATT